MRCPSCKNKHAYRTFTTNNGREEWCDECYPGYMPMSQDYDPHKKTWAKAQDKLGKNATLVPPDLNTGAVGGVFVEK